MLITAVCGLIFNLIQVFILHENDGHYHLGQNGHDHDHDHEHDHKPVSPLELPNSRSNVLQPVIVH
jgi:hypothetical protein